MRSPVRILAIAAALVAAVCVRATAAGAPMTLVVDAREAPRNMLHVDLTIPVDHAGPLTLVYPKWIPGEHSPDGPIANVAEIRMQAGGVDLPWQRDYVDLYAFHVDVPAGAHAIRVTWTQLMTHDDPMSTPNMLIVNWNRVVMYPSGSKSDDVTVKPSLILPDGWTFGTALAGPSQAGDRVDFDRASLTTLVDSPLDAGRYERRIVLLQDPSYSNEIDAFADDPSDLRISDDDVRKYKNVVAEADALYGSRHWHHYHFLLTLTDAIPFQGIEHHESSDNRASAHYWTDPDALADSPDLLPHEFSHSWNGKYRRPADLWQPDYQAPERTDLLWVYEGLNQYLGDLLAFRSGFLPSSDYPDFIAYNYAREDIAPGRLADPLVDTAIAAPYLYTAPSDWRSERRTSDDFYTEGELVWLSVDAIIRTQSHGSKSLDDFLRAFYGGHAPDPTVVTYTRQDVVDALSAVQPYDWNGFFQRWVYDVAPHPAADGIDLTGWKLVWTSTPNRRDELAASEEDTDSFAYSLGFDVKSGGGIADVLDGSPAARAGLGANVTLLAVDGEKYSAAVLRDAIDRAKTSTAPIELLAQSGDRYQTIDVDYHGGNRYPHLERVPNLPDLLAQIAAPHRAAAAR